MDFLKVEQDFNWDDIVVGDNRLDHSENFFAVKHIKHEKFNVTEHFTQEFVEEHVKHEKFEEIENFTQEFAKKHIKQEKSEEADPLIHEFAEKVSLYTLESDDKLKNDIVKDEKENICDNINKLEGDALDGTLIQPKKPNLAASWSGRVKIVRNHIPSTRATEKSLPPTPEAYKIHFVYKKKHEEAKRRMLEAERKRQEFHPRPMPNFNKCQEQTKKKRPAPKFTLPVTPQLLKNYYKAQEVRKRKMLETKAQLQSVKFTSNSADVLREKPFVPQKKKATRIDQKPFSLHLEQRVQQRKQFDEIMQRHLTEKRKQAEQKRKELEDEQIKALRKAATFKARPNPFKH